MKNFRTGLVEGIIGQSISDVFTVNQWNSNGYFPNYMDGAKGKGSSVLDMNSFINECINDKIVYKIKNLPSNSSASDIYPKVGATNCCMKYRQMQSYV